MIRAEYAPREHTLLVRGHAGSGDPGRDLVCAGVSTLVLALRQELLRLEEAGAVSIRRLRLEPGYAELCGVPAAHGDGLELVYETVVGGLELLQKLFGEYVTIDIVTGQKDMEPSDG